MTTVYRTPLFGYMSTSLDADGYRVLSSGGWNYSATEAEVQLKYYYDGWLTNLRVYVSANTASQARTLTIRKAGANTAVTLSITASTTGFFEDVTNQVAVTSGDLISVGITGSGGTGSITVRTMGADYLSATAFNKIGVGGSSGYSTASARRYIRPTALITLAATEDAIIKTQAPCVTTAKNLQVIVTGNARSTATSVYLRVNAVDGNLTVSIPASTTGFFEDTTHTDSISAGDYINYSTLTSTGTGTITFRAFSVDLENTTAGTISMICGQLGTSIATGVSRYCAALAGAADFGNSTEANLTQRVHGTGTIKNLLTEVTTNDAANATVSMFRKNAADTALTFSVAATTTGTASDLSHSFTFADNDTLDIKLSRASGSSGSYTAGWYSYEFVSDGETAPSGGTTYNDSFTETVTGSDSFTVALTAVTTVTESVTSSDSLSPNNSIPVSVSESLIASDSLSVDALFSATITETLSGTDSLDALLTANTTITETITNTDSLSTGNIISASIAETATLSDSYAATLDYYDTIIETVTGVDSLSVQNILTASISETITATDSLSGSVLFSTSFTEALTGSDSLSIGASAYSLAISETIETTMTLRVSVSRYDRIVRERNSRIHPRRHGSPE